MREDGAMHTPIRPRLCPNCYEANPTARAVCPRCGLRFAAWLRVHGDPRVQHGADPRQHGPDGAREQRPT
jgi:predicted amidophosphoribosyltransferase